MRKDGHQRLRKRSNTVILWCALAYGGDSPLLLLQSKTCCGKNMASIVVDKVSMLKFFYLLLFYFVPVFLAFYIYLFLLFNMDGKQQQQEWQAKKAFKANYIKWFLSVTSSKAVSKRCPWKITVLKTVITILENYLWMNWFCEKF